MPDFLQELLQTPHGPWFFLLAGGLMLWWGAEGLVRGATALAHGWGLSPMIIGATIVAFGTSAPEWVVSVQAQLNDKPASALGNIVGSNLTNLALVLGCTALLMPIPVRRLVATRELPIVLVAQGIFVGFAAHGGLLTPMDGIWLLLVFVAIFFYLLRDALRSRDSATLVELSEERLEETEAPVKGNKGLQILLVVLGLGGLAIGSDTFVRGAEIVGTRMGLGESEIGLLLLAFGTSLPELVTSVVAAMRQHLEISLGNLLGSNLFNVLFVGGSMALFGAVPVDEQQWWLHIPAMNLVTLALFPMLFLGATKLRLTRGNGLVLLLLHLAWVTTTFLTLPETPR